MTDLTLTKSADRWRLVTGMDVRSAGGEHSCLESEMTGARLCQCPQTVRRIGGYIMPAIWWCVTRRRGVDYHACRRGGGEAAHDPPLAVTPRLVKFSDRNDPSGK